MKIHTAFFHLIDTCTSMAIFT